MIEKMQYIFESFDEKNIINAYYSGDLHLTHLMTFAKHYTDTIARSRGNHTMNGNDWATMCGIIDAWRRSHPNPKERDLSNKQAVFVIGVIARSIQSNIHLFV